MSGISRELPKVFIVYTKTETEPAWMSAMVQKRIQIVLESSFQKAIDTFSEENPDLIIIYVNRMTPAVLGLIQEFHWHAVNPVLLFCDTPDEEDQLDAYSCGVDDCIIKPVSPALFLAKVKAWLRRSWTIPTEAMEPIRADKLVLIPAKRELVLRDGSTVLLTNMEIRLLHALMSHRDQPIGSDELIRRMWGFDGKGGRPALKSLVYRLRKKLEKDPSEPCPIINESGFGYSFSSRVLVCKS